MDKELQLIIISAIFGGIAGSFFSALVPRLIYDPRLVILGIETQPSFGTYNVVVLNKGRTAALNAVAHITIRPITSDSILITHAQQQKYLKSSKIKWWENGYWKKDVNAFLCREDWKLGIESEHLFWATFPNSFQATINPGLPQRVVLAHSEGTWIDIASETPKVKRTRLDLLEDKVYFCEVIIAAENTKPSKPFRFEISIGSDEKPQIRKVNHALPKIVTSVSNKS